LQKYDFSKPDDFSSTIGEIWGGNTIFYYEKEKAVE
jgi:hypothetical protein